MRKFYVDDARLVAEYIRTGFPEHAAEQKALADSECDNTFIFTDRYEMERCTRPVTFKDGIDWNYVPFGDEEWNFAFSRHTFLGHLSRTFLFSGEAKYRENFIRLFRDFASSTKLDDKTRSRSWRSLECGIRIENWIRGFELFERSGNRLDDGMYETLERLLREHEEYLKDTHTAFHRLSNWGALQDHGLFLIGAYFDDEDTMALAVERLDEEFMLQTFSDGTHWEQSPMYQAEVLHAGLDTALVASRIGWRLPKRLLDNIHLLALGMMRSARPDGKCYLFGDSDEIDFRDQAAIAAALFEDSELSYFAGRPDAEFHWSCHDMELPAPAKPSSLSFFFADSGNAIVRMGNDSALRFHAGLYGSGHGHLDQLHFDLYHKGRVLITDLGRGTYVDGEWRRALKGPLGHNTVIIDKKGFSEMTDSWGIRNFAEPVMSVPVFGKSYNLLEAMHFGYFGSAVVVRRRILTIEERALLVLDEVMLADSGEHSVDILFHFDEETKAVVLGGNRIVMSAQVRIVPDRRLDSKISRYPYSRRYNERSESCMLTLSGRLASTTTYANLISYGEMESISIEPLTVTKSLSGKEVPEAYGRGYRIRLGNDTYDVLGISREFPEGGFLLRCGTMETYARVAIRKNDEEVAILRR